MKTATIENQVNRVSKKVYADIVSRVNDTFGTALKRADLIPKIVEAIDDYIADGTLPTKKDSVIILAFYMVKAEIDRAAERSRRARERAALRREKLQAAKSVVSEPTDNLESAESQSFRPQTDAICGTIEKRPLLSHTVNNPHGAVEHIAPFHDECVRRD